MSKTVDERVVSMRFDNAQFERGAKQTMDTLNQLEKSLSLDGAKKGIQEAGKAINSFSLEGIASQIDSLKAKFDWKSIIGVTALMNIANDVVNTFKNMVNQISVAPIKQGFDEYELKMGAVQTMIASTGESLETVNGYLEQLNQYADKTIYSFSDMTQNIGKFTNNGVKLEDAVNAIKGVSNAAAVAGANSNEASRAMYNFSQALSQGSVKLIDWKSIQNANMATVDFKQNLIDTAVALGTVKKQGDQYVSTTTDLNGNVSDLFDANKMFNESLSSSWMTTEVLVQTLSNYSTDVSEMKDAELDAYKAKLKSIGYTDEQIKKIVELSEKANKAATEVKTFSQLMDTLAEATGSGWSQTFEIIFGDFEESKRLWTAVSDVVGGFIDETSKARNAMLEAWDAFGGRTELLNALKNAFNNMADILTAIKEAFREIFPKDMTAKFKGAAGAFKEVRGGARLLVEATEGLSNAVKTLTPSATTLENISRTFRGVFAVLDMGKKIIVSIFRAIKPNSSMLIEAGSNILDVTARIGDALAKFDENFDPEKSFGKFLNGIRIVINELQSFIADITDFKFQVEEWGTGLGGIFAIIFNDLIYLPIEAGVRLIGRLLGKTDEELAEWHEKFLRPLSNIRGAIVDFLDNFKPFENLNFKMPDFSGFKEFADTIIDRVNPLQTAWNILKGIGTGIVKVFSTIGTVLGPIGKSLGGALSSFFDMIADYFKNATFDEVIDLINSGILTVLGVQLAGLAGNLKDISGAGKTALESLKGPAESVKKLGEDKSISGIGEAIGNLFGVIKDESDSAGILKTMSESILMLAGALFVLALIPSDKLTVSMLAITGLFADLMKSMEFMEKSLGGGKKTLSVAASLTLVSGAMLEMALAMQVMSAMSWERVAKGLTSFAVSMGVITATFKALKGEDLIKTAGAIWIVSNAMIQMGVGMQALSAMSWDRVGKGMIVFATSMGTMVLAFKALKNDDIIKTAGAIWIFSNAMIQMGAALQIMGAMSWSRVAKSLIVFAGSMLVMVKAFNSMSPEALMSTAGAIWVFSNAMIQMGIALQIMGAMSLGSLAKSLVALAVSMRIMVNAFNELDNKQLVQAAAAMWIFGQAMIGMGTALQIMGAMSLGSLIKSLVAFGGTIGILILALNNIKALDAVKIAGSLMLISVAMTTMAVALGLLGALGWQNILTALGALAGTLLVLGTAAAILDKTGLDAAIVHLGVALAAAGAGMLLVGMGIASVAAGLIMLSTVGPTAIGTILASIEMLVVGGLKIFQHSAAAIAELIVSLVDDILVLIRGIIPNLVETFLLLVDEVLASLASHGPEILRSVITIISELFTQINAYLPTFITQLTDFIIAIIDGIAANLPRIIVSIMNLVGSLLQGAIDALNQLDTETLVNGILAIGMMSALMLSLAGMTALAAPAAAGVVAFGGVITELGLILAAIGAFSKIPGLEWLINEGGDFLNSIGQAIGKFIGGIGEGITNSFPIIGRNLSAFMENASSFIDVAKTIDRSVYNGIDTLIDSMLLVTGGSFLTRLTSFISGDSDFGKFAYKLSAFGSAINSFAVSTKDVDARQVEKCADATLALVEMAQQIPNTGGLVSLITGDNSLQDFGLELNSFGVYLRSFANNIEDVDPAQVEGAAKATLLLTEMASSIPNSGGLVSLITGDNSLSDFGYELNVYGTYLKSFSANLKGLRIKAINDAADATGKLIAMAKQVPNSGGLVSLITGDNSLGDFGKELGVYGKHLAKFGSYVKGLMSEDFTGAIDATERLILMASTIPNTGGIVSWVTGDNSLADFGAELAKFGPKLAKFSDSIKGINTTKIKVAADAVKTLTEIKIPTNGGILTALTGKQSLSKYGKELKTFGLNLALFDDNTSGIDYANMDKAIKATQDILAIELPTTGGIFSWFTGDVKLGRLGGQFKAFAPGLMSFASEVDGINVEAVENGAKAASALLNVNYPTTGGVFSWFTGDIELGKFGEQIGSFASGLKSFANTISGTTFDEAKTEAAAKCAKSLISLANDAPPTSGIKTWISGKDRLANFADQVVKFAQKMFTGEDNVLTAISGITNTDVDNAKRVGDILNAFVNGLADIKPKTLGNLGTAMKTLGKGVLEFSKSVTSDEFDIQKVSAVISQLDSVSKLANDLKTVGDTDFSNLIYLFGQMSSDQLVNLADAFTNTMNVGTECIKTIIEKLNEFTYDIGMDKQTITTHLSGIEKAIELLRTKTVSEFDVIKSNLSMLLSSFKIAFDRETYEQFGNNVTLGIADGLDTDLDKVEGSAKVLADMIIKTIEDRLDEHSPSREAARLGRYFDRGLAEGMTSGISEIEDSGSSAADAAMNSMKEAFKNINTLAEEELTTEPVIKPVLDLSNIEGSNRLGTIFTAGIGLSSGFKNAQGIIRSKDINSATNNTSAIDPKQMNELLTETKLMREEIGNFSNELSNMKVVMDSGALVGQIGPGMDLYLGQKAVQLGRSI